MRALAVLRGRIRCVASKLSPFDGSFIALATFAFALIFLTTPTAVRAACPIPHRITNGQVADATEIMDNFNAVGSCARRRTWRRWEETYQTGTATQRNTLTGVFYLHAGDYVTVEQAQTSGTSRTVQTTLALVKI